MLSSFKIKKAGLTRPHSQLILDEPSEQEENDDYKEEKSKEERKVERTSNTSTYSTASTKSHKKHTSLIILFLYNMIKRSLVLLLNCSLKKTERF